MTHRLEKMVFFHQTGFSLWDITEDRVAYFRPIFPDIQFVSATGMEPLARESVDADAICSMRITAELVQGAKRLQWIHSPAAGLGGLMIPEVLNSDIAVTNAKGVLSEVMAEHAMGFILACSRRFLDSFHFQHQHQWAQEKLWTLKPTLDQVQGKTLGIVGLGSIGREISKRARAFGMQILAVKRNPESGGDAADRVFPLSQLETMLHDSDFVVLALPHTPETKHVMSDAQFAAMKPSAYLINIARGKLIDEKALLRALDKNLLAGAALDVLETEPLPPDSPLWDHPRVFITPHCSSVFPDFWPRSRTLIAENIRRFLGGKTLLNLIDKKKGY